MYLFKLRHVYERDVLLILWDDQRIAFSSGLEQEVLRNPTIVIEDAVEDTLLNLTQIHADPLAECLEPFIGRWNGNTVDKDGSFRAFCC